MNLFPKVFLVLAAVLNLMWSSPVQASFELKGTRQVIALLADSQEVQIGEVVFTPLSSTSAEFLLTMDHSKFTDYFLSMREFKCLEGATEVNCHVPYPYQSPQLVANDQYVWLEHRLMFLFKKPDEFGAKLWNGIYFKFKQDGNSLVGLPQAIDLNQIGAPPSDLNIPPYLDDNRHEMNAAGRLVKAIVIR